MALPLVSMALTDRQKLALFTTALRDLLGCVDSRRDGNRGYEEVVSQFEAHYAPGSFSTYLFSFCQLLHRADTMPEPDKLAYFLNGLSPSLGREVEARCPPTIAATIILADGQSFYLPPETALPPGELWNLVPSLEDSATETLARR